MVFLLGKQEINIDNKESINIVPVVDVSLRVFKERSPLQKINRLPDRQADQ